MLLPDVPQCLEDFLFYIRGGATGGGRGGTPLLLLENLNRIFSDFARNLSKTFSDLGENIP